MKWISNRTKSFKRWLFTAWCFRQHRLGFRLQRWLWLITAESRCVGSRRTLWAHTLKLESVFLVFTDLSGDRRDWWWTFASRLISEPLTGLDFTGRFRVVLLTEYSTLYIFIYSLKVSKTAQHLCNQNLQHHRCERIWRYHGDASFRDGCAQICEYTRNQVCSPQTLWASRD